MKRISIFIAALALLASCQQPVPQAFSVIPYPNEVNLTEGTYNVKGTAIAVDPARAVIVAAKGPRLKDAVQELQLHLMVLPAVILVLVFS